LYEVPRNPAAEKKIRNAVIQFWLDVRDGKEPDADYGKDKDLIAGAVRSSERQDAGAAAVF
jgi:hypothetical protein